MPVDNYQNADYKKTDDRGRVTLGQEYANGTVAVAWSEVDVDPEDTIRPPEEEREKLAELTRWGIKNDHSVLDYDLQEGRIYTDDAEWVDTDVGGLGE